MFKGLISLTEQTVETCRAVTKKNIVSPSTLRQRLQIYHHVVCPEVCQPIIMRNHRECLVLENAAWLLADLHCCFHYLLICRRHF